MNHIYRLVWNKKRRMLMAVAEIGCANGKDAAGTTRGQDGVPDGGGAYSGARTLLATALLALFPLVSFAQQGMSDYIPAGTSLSVSDGDGSNALLAGTNLTNDGTLDITGTDAGSHLVSLSGSGTVLMDARTLTLTAADGFYLGTLQGSGSLVVAGGYETLGGVNVHGGVTQVDQYAGLSLSGSGSIALSSGLLNNGMFDIAATNNGAKVNSLSGSGTVWLGGQTLTLTNAGDTFAGMIAGFGGVNVAGGTQVLSGTNIYFGATSIDQGGALALSGSGSIALSSGVANNGVFDIAATDNGAQVTSLSGSGTVWLGGQTLTLTNAGDTFAGMIAGFGGVNVAGGTQVLSGTNIYFGATSIDQGGALALSGSGSIALSSGVANNGVLDIVATDNGAEVRSLSGSGAVLLGGQTLTLTDAGDTFAGSIYGSGGLTIAGGMQVLSGTNTYNGATSIDQGGALALSGSGSIALSSGIANNGVFDIAATNNGAEVRSLSGSGAVLLGGQTLTLTNAGDTFAGSILGSGGLTIAGGIETLSGTNTYSGATSIDQGGALALSGSGSIALSSGVANNGVLDIAATNNGAEVRSLSGSGAVLLGGQTLALTDAGDTFAGSIHGSGGLTIAGGIETLSGTNTYNGATSIDQGGALALSGSGSIALSSGIANNGVFDIAATNNGAEVRTLSGSGAVLLGGQTLTLTDAQDVFAGSIHGSGGMTIAGGMQVLSGTNTYNGATSVDQGGALALSGSGSIALSSGVANNGVFDIAATDNGAEVRTLSGSGAVLLGGQTLTLTNAGDTFAGSILGSGGLTIAGGIETLSGTNTYSGATSIDQGGGLALSGSGGIALSSGVANNGVLDIAATNNGAEVRTLSGSGAVLLGGQTLTLTDAGDTFAGSIHGSGGLTIAGGIETLSGTNTYSGATSIDQGGGLALSGSGSIALSSGVANNGVLDIAATNNGAEVRTLSGSGAVLLGGQTLTLTDAQDVFAGGIHGSGGLTIAGGIETLSGTNTYSGATSIDQVSALALSGSGSIALSSGVANNGVFDIAATNNGAEVRTLSGSGAVLLGGQTLTLTNAGDTFAGSILGSGGLTIAGGIETLSGTNTYTGATSIDQDGALALSGSGSIALSSGVANNGVLDITATDNGAEVRTLSGSGAVLLGGQTLTLTNAGDTFAGSILGSGGLTIAGGIETLSGTNTYSGATSIDQGGGLALSGSGSIALSSGVANNGVLDIAATDNGAEVRSLSGSGAVLLGGQTLTLTNAGDTFAGSILGSGGLTIAGGIETLSGTNTYSGATSIDQGGALALSGSGSIALSSGVANNGVLDIAATDNGAEVRTLSGSGAVLLGGQTLTLTDAGDTFAGSIHGSGGLTIAGGIETVSGTNTYTGATSIDQGGLVLSGSGSIALSSGVANNGVLDITATDNGAEVRTLSGSGAVLLGGQTLTLTNAGDTFAGSILGSGGLTIAGGIETLSGTNTYNGATSIDQGGALALSGSGSIALSSGVANNGVLDIAATDNGAEVRTLSGSGAVLLGGQTLTLTDAGDTFAGSIHGSGGLTIAGGIETLSGTNTYTGATSINQGGALALSGSGGIALSSGVANNGLLDIAATDNGAQVRTLSGSGAVLLGGQTLTLTDAQDVFAGGIHGSGGLTIAGGIETLAGTNTYNGATSIDQGGALALSGSGSIALSSGVANNGVLDIAATNNGAEVRTLSGSGVVLLGGQTMTLTDAQDVFAGGIHGSGGLTIAGGTQVLSGTNTYSGATSIDQGGALALSGSGSIALSSGVANNGVLDIAATNNGAEVHSLSGSGAVLLGGQTLTLTDAGDAFAGSIHGSGGLTIAGGIETLSGTNTYTGATSINQGGALALSGSGGIALSSGVANNGLLDIAATDNGAQVRTLSGSGAVLLGGQTLTLTDAQDVSAGGIHGSGGLTIAGGIETLSGTNTYTGATSIDQGGLALSGSGSIALSSGVANNGVFDIAATNNGAEVRSLSGSGVVLLGGQTLTLTDAADTFAGSILGSGGLTIAGGTETLAGTNTYNGATSIDQGGALALSGSGSIALSSGVANNGVLDIAATDNGAEVRSLSGSGAVLLGGQTLTLTDAQDVFAGSIHGSGGLTIAAGTETLTGVNTHSGTTAVSHGATLALAGNGSIGNSRVQTDGTLDVSASTGGVAVQSLGGSGAVLLGGQTLTLTNAGDTFAGSIHGSGGLAIAAGTETLTGVNTHTGATAVSHGATLALAGNGSIGNSRVQTDGTLDVSASTGGAAVKSLGGSGAVLLGGQTLTLTDAGDTFTGSIHGSGGLAIAAGTETLTGVNTHTGATAVSHGATLALAGNGSIGNSRVRTDGTLDVSASTGGAAVQSLGGSGAVLLGGQTLTLTDAGDTFTGSIHGSGGLTIAGGTETLAGTNTNTGATSIGHDGGLALSGSGSIALSSGVANDGVLDIAATGNGAQVRTLSGSGAVLLGGQTLTLTNAGDTFAGSIHGSGGLAIAAGTETLTGVNTHTGTTAVSHGATLALAGNGSIGNSRVQTDGTLDVSASTGGAAVKSLGGSGAVLLGGHTLTLTDAAGAFNGRISGSGGIAIADGSQALTTTQAYTGATSIGAGATLTLAGNGLIAASSRVVADGTLNVADAGATIQSLAGDGMVQLGSQTLTLTAARDVFGGTIAGDGALNLTGGTATLAGNNTYRGATYIGGGATLALSGQGSIASSSGVDVDGRFDISGTDRGATVRTVSGAGTIYLGAQTLALSRAAGLFAGTIVGAGGLSVDGGRISLGGVNDYTGTTSIAGGAALALSGAGSIAGSAVRDDGVFDVSGAAHGVAIKGLSGSGSVLLGANDLTVTAAAGRFGGNIAGSGSLKVTGGTLTLDGANDYTGKTVVSGGTLRTYADANLGKGSAALELDNGTWQTSADLTHERGLALTGRGTVDVDAGTVTTENGTVGGSGTLVKQGTGTLVLRGVLANGGLQVEHGTVALHAANTYTGDTAVSRDGILRIDSDANLGAAGNRLVLDGGTLQTTGSMTSDRAFTITARNGVLDAEGADSVVTLNGNIGGDGRLVKEGQGTLVLGGDNGGGQGSANAPGDGWTGGLTINDGLVKVTNAYGLGWGSVMTFNAGTIYATVDIATGQDIRMGRSTNINTEANTTTTLAGDLLSTGAGDGCFTKTGQGTLNVTGNANIDATCVLEGKLLANGLFNSRVTVAHGATLGGSGTVKGDLLVQGTLSPGNSPGMLTADSNITMAAGSTYKEDIGGTAQATPTAPVGAPGYYSYLHVVGGKRFTIEPGATLAPTLKNLYSPDEAGYGSAPLKPELGQSFRIVTADGGIAGRFDTLVQPDGMDGTRMAAFYNVGGNNSIELKVLPASYADWSRGGNANSRAVAGALDRIVDLDQSGRAGERQDLLLYRVGSATADRLGGLLRGLSGEVHGSLAAAAPQAGWNLQRSVLKHTADDGDRALWLDLAGTRGKWSGDADASGFKADRLQVTAGLDVLRGADYRLGVGASYAHTDVSAGDDTGKLRQNKVFVYGETTVDGLTFDGIGSVGRDKADSRRADPLATSSGLSAHAGGNAALLGVGVRAERELLGAKVEPFARLTVQRVERDGLAETPASAAALTVDGDTATGTRLQAGLAAASRNADPLRASTYRVNLGAGVDAGGLLRPTRSAWLAGERVTIGAPGVGRAFVQGGVTGTLHVGKGAYLYYGVTGEGRGGYYQVGGNAGVRAVF
ncbi:ESPR-type extended signal peptide-containing protein [Massilia sp. GER05]|uniref:ESPR-type extended signal peptide-containing protein n=1 Tax=Massilia sp. GER05 TaxID=3394605 RepID=UPI003F85114E